MKQLNNILLTFVILGVKLFAQTNPAPQAIPFTQNFGTTTFTAPPIGIAVWNGISGGATSTQALAEASTPLGNATIAVATAIQVSGGAYGYAAGGNAQLYIQSSSNATNGVNQLALAINTMDIQNVKVSYKITMLFTQIRSVGVVLQYRVGTTGAWTSVNGTSYYHSNIDRISGAEDLFTDIILPSDAGNKPVIQLRWAIWRGAESATSSGIGIDDISVSSAGSGIIVPNPKLFSLNFVTSDKINLVWEAPTFGDDSVLVFARQDSMVEYFPVGLGRSYTNASTNFLSAGSYGNSKLVYNGTDNNVTIFGLTESKKYYFKAFAYRDTVLSSGTPIIFDTTEVHGVSNFIAQPENQQIKLLWSNYSGPQGVWWNEVLIVAKAGTATDSLPKGDGTNYTAHAQFGIGTSLGNGNFVVYKGVTDTLTVTGLTNGTTYAFRIFVRNNFSWSGGWKAKTITAIPTNGPVTPAVPDLISPANGSASISISPQLLWNSVLGASTYRVQVSLQSDFSTFVVNDSTVTQISFLVKSLQVNTKYYWRINAKNNAATSEFSAVYSFSTANAYQVPQQILFSGQTSGTLLNSVITNYRPSTTQGYPPPALFGEAYKLPNGNVRCVYTGLETSGGSGMNVEHTYPQSKGASGQAKNDMHHLFPTQIGVNSDRGNYPFSDIPDNEVSYWYRGTTKTPSKPTTQLDEYSKVKSGVTFEPRADHKGNVARSIFYFYTMYASPNGSADAAFFNVQKATLYRWHYLDPVDSAEYARTNIIAKYQSAKPNPFVIDTTLIRRTYFPQIIVGFLEKPIIIPTATMLEQNYPNPFNPTTTINYSVGTSDKTFQNNGNGFSSLPDRQAGVPTTLKIYDALGREVATLVNGKKNAGNYSVTFDASELATGIYFAKLQSGDKLQLMKMLLLK